MDTNPLSPREWTICRLVTAGKRNGDIARELGTSEAVAAQWLKLIMRRIDASNRAMVAAWYVRMTEVRS